MTLSVPRVGGHRGKTHSGPFARVVENSYRYSYLTLPNFGAFGHLRNIVLRGT